MRTSQIRLGNPLVPVFNDFRGMVNFTYVQRAQREGVKIAKYNPLEWLMLMRYHPGKNLQVAVISFLLLGGWGFDFLKNLSVMGQEKPPIDWNNQKIGYMKRL
eukprot:RCo036393